MNRAVYSGLVLLILSLPVATGVRAQADNVLNNPGFEEDFQEQDDNPLLKVAEGWTSWYRAAEGDNAAAWELVQPEYGPARDVDEHAHIREGETSQVIRSFYATFDAGLLQEIADVEVNSWLRFSANAWVWSSVLDDPEQSEDDGDVFVQVGIDPDGGTDPDSEEIVWSEISYELYDGWREYAVVTQATGEEVSVFVRALVGQPVRNTHVWIDETQLFLDVFDEEVVEALAVAIGPTPFPTAVPVYHIVGEGESLEAIARRYSISVDAILKANNLVSASLVHPGSQLYIPAREAPVATPLPEIEANAAWYVIRAGDTFAGIAELYGVDVAELAALNQDVNTSFLVVGQALVVPAVPSPPTSMQSYTVRRGDTLGDIALRFNISVEELASANDITVTSNLEAGQILVIP